VSDNTNIELLKLSHRMDLSEQDEEHSRIENEAEHTSINKRISDIYITVDGHEVRIQTLEGKVVAAKAKLVDALLKWLVGIIAAGISGAILFWLGTLYRGGQ
jgi:hypothetical protein